MLREFTVDIRHATTDRDTIFSLLQHRAEREPDGVIAQWQKGAKRQWQLVTAAEMMQTVRSVAKGLLSLGIRKGDMIAIYSATCYDWGVVDFAAAAIGAVTVPIYETDSLAQAQEIIADTHPKIAFVGDYQHAQTLEQIRQAHSSLQYVFNFMADAIKAMKDFGESVSDVQLDSAIEQVHADDLATIVYTSGSTGKPKGAMLTHRNFMHIIFAGYDVLHSMIFEPNRILLFLPLAHCFARYIQYVAIGGHGVIGYVPDAKHLLADLRSFKPTYLLGVPRVFEKVYNAASQKAGFGIKGRLFSKAYQHFARWSEDEMNGIEHGPVARVEHTLFMNTVGASIKSALGSNLSYLACGGAPMSKELAHFFNGIDGITFIQGYGLTETAAPCVVNFEDANTVGSVGLPGPGITIRLADDDEVLIKGPNVFKGYYQQPQLTEEVLDADGWLHSGDIGSLDDDGFLYITGRKKDIIITAGGKNVSPAILESSIAKCPLVSHAVLVGDGKPFIGALVTFDEPMTRDWLAQQGIDATMSMSAIAHSDAVRAFIQQFVDKANTNVSRAESVRKFVILDEDFSQDAGTLTPSLKIVRPRILERYADVINTVLYAPKPQTAPVSTTSKLLDSAAETLQQASESMQRMQESVDPMIQQALQQVYSNDIKTDNAQASEEEPNIDDDDTSATSASSSAKVQ